eukprot:scaffold12978_cov51-Phaeocystis_antarctica.AAC.7
MVSREAPGSPTLVARYHPSLAVGPRLELVTAALDLSRVDEDRGGGGVPGSGPGLGLGLGLGPGLGWWGRRTGAVRSTAARSAGPRRPTCRRPGAPRYTAALCLRRVRYAGGRYAWPVRTVQRLRGVRVSTAGDRRSEREWREVTEEGKGGK